MPVPSPSCAAAALGSLLAADLQFSWQLGMCARVSARPHLLLLEVSGHGVPWLAGTLYGLGRSESPAGRKVLLNLLFMAVAKRLQKKLKASEQALQAAVNENEWLQEVRWDTAEEEDCLLILVSELAVELETLWVQAVQARSR
ncbi:ATP-dependent DNA helicase Q1 [Platysternon megacephalum]|uniref:ATP-dependent DNA helicase Q1 n=1 Tax=Platysternon megacephalum TaxID=55544 RepID=A0A4D9EEH4_9SAUR|nr:ATP-dependent DNA helicase Q1 [Platysternon megacephalum]